MRERMERMRLIDKIAQFFADEKVAAVIEPSRDGKERRRLRRHVL